MGFLREVNEEKAELQNKVAEREHEQSEELQLERSKRVALQRRMDADEADRLAAHDQVKTTAKLAEIAATASHGMGDFRSKRRKEG